MTDTFPATFTRPPFFCLSDKYNTHVILTKDGWYNSDTEITYPFDSPTGKFYDGLALQTAHCQAQAKLEEMRAAHPEWDALITWEDKHPLAAAADLEEHTCTCYDLPDGRGYVCPVCQAEADGVEIPF